MVDSDISKDKPTVTEPSSYGDEEKLGTVTTLDDLTVLGYKPELQRNRSMFTLLFQSLAIAAVSTQWLKPLSPHCFLPYLYNLQIPFGFGGPLISAVYGGGKFNLDRRSLSKLCSQLNSANRSATNVPRMDHCSHRR